MRRREFVQLVTGAVALGPVVASARQSVPAIGLLSSLSPEPVAKATAVPAATVGFRLETL